MNHFPIHLLPPEIIGLILSFLSPKDLVQASHSCRLFFLNGWRAAEVWAGVARKGDFSFLSKPEEKTWKSWVLEMSGFHFLNSQSPDVSISQNGKMVIFDTTGYRTNLLHPPITRGVYEATFRFDSSNTSLTNIAIGFVRSTAEVPSHDYLGNDGTSCDFNNSGSCCGKSIQKHFGAADMRWKVGEIVGMQIDMNLHRCRLIRGSAPVEGYCEFPAEWNEIWLGVCGHNERCTLTCTLLSFKEAKAY